MNLLILGSCGFIGTNLCEYLIDQKHDVIGCDIIPLNQSVYSYYKISLQSNDLDEIFKNNTFDICINASGSANVANSILYPLQDFEANVFSVAKVLETIRVHKPHCKYLHISSAAVYGNPNHLPIVESDPLKPVSPYGFNKLMGEILCKKYFNLFNIPVSIIRPFSIYGNGLKKQILWDTCTKLKSQNTILLFGQGDESRDFIHISDFCKIIEIVIVNSKFEFDIYNAASGIQTSISDIAKIFEDQYQNTVTINFNGEVKLGDPKYWLADISKIRVLGFTPKANLAISIANYIQWFKQYYGN